LAGVPLDVNEQIADLEEQLDSPSMQRVLAMNGGKLREDLKRQLAELREQAKQQSMREMGVGGTPAGASPGFGPDTKAAEKAAAERRKKAIEGVNDLTDAIMEAHEATAKMNEELDQHAERLADNVDEHFEDIGKALEGLEIEDHTKKQVEMFNDLWNDGFDAWEQNGELSAKKLGQFLLMELGQRVLSELLDKWAASLGGLGTTGGTSGGTDWLGTLGGLFGGGRAAGGPIQAGKFYRVGEEGPELLAAGTSGTIIPNHAMGGGPSIVIHNSIDARGASVDLVKALPAILDQNSRATEARIIERIGRGYYPTLH
jgi:hypothetical protein